MTRKEVTKDFIINSFDTLPGDGTVGDFRDEWRQAQTAIRVNTENVPVSAARLPKSLKTGVFAPAYVCKQKVAKSS